MTFQIKNKVYKHFHLSQPYGLGQILVYPVSLSVCVRVSHPMTIMNKNKSIAVKMFSQIFLFVGIHANLQHIRFVCNSNYAANDSTLSKFLHVRY